MKIGDCVKPLRRKKRKNSFWSQKFGHGKTYTVVDKDKLGGDEVLIVQEGDKVDDWSAVYPDEVVKVKKDMCRM